jgi:hypothetical protein
MKIALELVSAPSVLVEEPFDVRAAESQPSVSNILGLLALAVAIPYLSRISDELIAKDQGAYKTMWVVAFVANLLAVALPGRFDSRVANGEPFPWDNMFEPAAWAFTIWPLIYIAELAVTSFVASGNGPAKDFAKVAPFWVAGNLFQSAWCLSFRPPMKKFLWLPVSFLALSGACFGLGYLSLTNSMSVLSTAFNSVTLNTLKLVRVPFALHTAWLAAATLANLNAWLAMSNVTTGLQDALAFLSASAAGFAGAAMALRTRDPVPAVTVAWALAALGWRSQRRGDLAMVDAEGALAAPLEARSAVHYALANVEKVLAALLALIGAQVALTNPIF